jgi:hypothetical protein
MNWDAIGAIGEWAGALVVIFTLLYLARQIRENSRNTRVAGINNIADMGRDVHFTIAKDREIAEIHYRIENDPDSMDVIDKFRYEQFFWGVMRQVQAIYTQHEQGLMDDDTLISYTKGVVHALRTYPVAQQHWKKEYHQYPEKFRKWIDKLVEEAA